MIARIFAIIAILVLLATGDVRTLRAQQPVPPQTAPPPTAPPAKPQVPVFRGGTILVPVDVRIVGRDGKAITDLKQSDFTVFEDGVEQKISHFVTQSLVPETPKPGETLTPRQSLTGELQPQTRRVFLIVFGRGRLEPAKAVDAVLDFVHDRLLPQDLAAVFVHDRASDFTTDRESVTQVVERFKTSYAMIEAELNGWMTTPGAVYGSAGVPPKIQSQIDAIFQGPNGAPMREIPPSTPLNADRMALDLNETLNTTPIDASFGDFVEDNRQTMQDLGSIYTGIDYLRRFDGEKHLVFVSEKGLGLPRAEDDRDIGAAANDARVIIDTIEAGGLGDNAPVPAARASGAGNASRPSRGGRRGATPPPAPPPPATGTQLNKFFASAALETMAEMTGGIFSGHTFSAAALARVDDATRFSYLLGYYPTNAALDGHFRHIQVRVNRPDTTVMFRHGYFGEDSVTPFDRRQMITTSRITMAAAFEKEIHDIGLKVQAPFVKGPSAAGEIDLTATIDASRLGFVLADGRHADTLQIAVFCTDGDGRVVGQVQPSIKLNLSDDNFEKVHAEGLPYAVKIPVTVRPSQVRTVVYDYAADLVGTSIIHIKY